MEWMEVCITVACEDIERAEAIAHMVVPYGLYIEDYSDLEQGAQEIAHIDLIDEELLQRDRTHAVIHLYVSPEGHPVEAVAFLRERMKEANIPHHVLINTIQEADWANNWKQYFKPLAVGNKLLICPTWEQTDHADGRMVLSIDPGMAFGTGGHDTTRLVLETLEQYITSETTLLDVGCGSGILSMASLLLGAKAVVGVDIDPLAVKTAIENGQRNHMNPPRYTIVEGDLTKGISGQYDIIAANIVADAIIALSSAIPPLLKPNGVYIVSGIIDTREADVLPVLAKCGFAVIQRREQGGWICLACRKEHE